MLNEKIDAINLGCALFSFVGVICVARPTFIFGKDHATADTDGSPFVILCALLGAAAQSVVYVSMRRLQQVHYLVVINYFLLTSSVLSLLSLLVVQQVRAKCMMHLCVCVGCLSIARLLVLDRTASSSLFVTCSLFL